MSSRELILEALRRNQPEQVPLPNLPAAAAAAPGLVQQFAAAATAALAQVVDGIPAGGLDAIIAERYPGATVIASTTPGVTGTLRLQSVADPHELAALDLLVCEAELGVAENGAVWLTDSSFGQRAAAFIAERVVVLLDRQRIVTDMHAAYARLRPDATGFGVFVAGPSKTADIEQALVIGAHGPRSLTIVLTR